MSIIPEKKRIVVNTPLGVVKGRVGDLNPRSRAPQAPMLTELHQPGHKKATSVEGNKSRLENGIEGEMQITSFQRARKASRILLRQEALLHLVPRGQRMSCVGGCLRLQIRGM